MSDSTRPGDTPPDLPPEYAEAYRRGYERAYQRDDEDAEAEHTSVLDSLLDQPESFHRAPANRRPHRRDSEPRPTWFVPALLAGLALLLIVGAFGIGKVLSGQASDTDADGPRDSVATGDDGGTSTDTTPPDNENPRQDRYHGAIEVAATGGAEASCRSADGVDAGGHKVSYAASNIYDGDMSTAWRCNGNGNGVTVTIDLPEEIEIGEVGLIPGYAKTDAATGANRYAENNRITKVRWILGDSGRFVQTFNGSDAVRKLQTMRIPPTTTDELIIEILSTTPGPRNTTMISEVKIGRTAS